MAVLLARVLHLMVEITAHPVVTLHTWYSHDIQRFLCLDVCGIQENEIAKGYAYNLEINVCKM